MTIMNKDKVVYTDKFNIDAEGKAEIPFKYQTSNNLYDKVPNGGVLVLKIRSTIKEDDIICEKEDKKCIELLNAKEKKEELKELKKKNAVEDGDVLVLKNLKKKNIYTLLRD